MSNCCGSAQGEKETAPATISREAVSAYVAAPWELRSEAQRIMRILESVGVRVTSSWLTSTDEPSMSSLHGDPDKCRAVQKRDRDDIDAAHFVVCLSPEDQHRKGTGGRHVEFGYAMARGKGLVVHGTPGNVFQYAPEVVVTTTDEDLLHLVGIFKKVYHGQWP